jgi:hypothetical protein
MGKLSSSGANDALPFLQKGADAVVEICLTRLNEGEASDAQSPALYIETNY